MKKWFSNLIDSKIKLIVTLSIILFISSIAFAKIFSGNKDKNDMLFNLPSVSISKVSLQKNIKIISSIGIVRAAQGIEVSSTSSGIITSIQFKSGQPVQAGQILATLKNDDLKATVLEDEAKYNLAKLNADRSRKLVRNNYVSRQDADQTNADEKQTKAQLKHDQALLENTIIKAPFSGYLGISQINLGQYVSVGQTIVSLQDRSKMLVDFSIPEKQSDEISLEDKISVNKNEENVTVWQGKINALESQMDNDTRSLAIRAELYPPYDNLTPGMYVNVSVIKTNAENKMTVPQSAIVYNPYGNFIYTYKNGQVTQNYVNLGQKLNDNIIIEKGIDLNSNVVIEGTQKLFDGAKVQVVKN